MRIDLSLITRISRTASLSKVTCVKADSSDEIPHLQIAKVQICYKCGRFRIFHSKYTTYYGEFILLIVLSM